MKAILLISCLFILATANASDSLLSERFRIGDTLFIRSEYSGCKGSIQREARIMYNGSRLEIIYFDILEFGLVSKRGLSYEQMNIAESILKKYKLGKKLTNKEKKYVNMNSENSIFDFYNKYLKSDTTFLITTFESAKKQLVLVEQMLKEGKNIDKSQCRAENGNCRVKVTMCLSNDKRKWEYYSEGCLDTNAILSERIK